MYKLTDTFVLILLIFAVFLSVAYTTLNKLFAVFFIYYNNTHSKWPHISRWWCIMWIIITFSHSTPVRRPSAVNPGENSHKPHMLWNHSSLATFLSLTVKSNVHRFTHGELRKPQHTYVKHAVRTLRWIGHTRSFKVILICAGRNPERRVVATCN